MINEPKAMREIHEIRERLYEKMKHMTPEEYTAHINANAERLGREFGFTVQYSPNVPQKT